MSDRSGQIIFDLKSLQLSCTEEQETDYRYYYTLLGNCTPDDCRCGAGSADSCSCGIVGPLEKEAIGTYYMPKLVISHPYGSTQIALDTYHRSIITDLEKFCVSWNTHQSSDARRFILETLVRKEGRWASQIQTKIQELEKEYTNQAGKIRVSSIRP